MTKADDILVRLEDAISNIDYPGSDSDEWTAKAKAAAKELHALVTREPEKVWLNAMSLVRPSDELKKDVGGEIIRMVVGSQRPEPDEFGIRPWRQVLLLVTAS